MQIFDDEANDDGPGAIEDVQVRHKRVKSKCGVKFVPQNMFFRETHERIEWRERVSRSLQKPASEDGEGIGEIVG